MKNKKGFTLIELMAVIAILAILVVLAIPNILKIFTSSKEKAFLVQVKELYKAAEQEIINKNISNSSVIIKKFDSNEEDKKINLSGTSNVKYCIKIQDNKITSIAVSNGDYWYFNENIVSLSDISNEDNTKFGAENKRVSCDENGTIVYPTITLTTDQGSSGLDIGDIVTISKGTISEQFYVIDSNSNETILLAKYNLLIGNVYDYSDKTFIYNKTLSFIDNGYGLQSELSKGSASLSENNQYIGLVPFSGINYWDNQVCKYVGSSQECSGTTGLKNEYTIGGASYNGNPYPYVYKRNDTNVLPLLNYTNGYGIAQNNGYTISYYLEYYINRLGTNGHARLLTYEEAREISDLNNLIILGTSFWLGSVKNKRSVWFVHNGSFYNNYFAEDKYSGVRPVIEISTSDIHIS